MDDYYERILKMLHVDPSLVPGMIAVALFGGVRIMYF